MILSAKHKYIFIAVPKTGTTSIHSFVLNSDATAAKNCFPVKDSTTAKVVPVKGHITARDLKLQMGKAYDDYLVFGFVRSPYAKAVSAYFFYRNGQPITRQDNQRLLQARINVLLARVLPFSIWSLLIPLKTNFEYLVDSDGKILVDHIGLTEQLSNHLDAILKILSIPTESSVEVPKKNTSKHDSYSSYFKNGWHMWLFAKKYGKEIRFYNFLLNKDLPVEKLRGLNVL